MADRGLAALTAEEEAELRRGPCRNRTPYETGCVTHDMDGHLDPPNRRCTRWVYLAERALDAAAAASRSRSGLQAALKAEINGTRGLPVLPYLPPVNPAYENGWREAVGRCTIIIERIFDAHALPATAPRQQPPHHKDDSR
jgi:hypothetical protein